MEPAHKVVRYGGRKCKSKTGKPAKTTSMRMPPEFMEFVAARIAAGDARNTSEYLLGLLRAAASRLGIQL